jgi:hypothetical protein
MTGQHVITCRMLDQEGRVITAGLLRPDGAHIATALVTALDQPHMVLERCLFGGVRDVQVQIDDDGTIPAAVDRVFLHPQFGRVCALRLTDLPAVRVAPLVEVTAVG